MDSTIIVAILGFAGTILGSGLGVIASSKLTSYRIEQLEKKVDEHNGVMKKTLVLEEKVKEIAADVKELKEYHK